MKKTKQKPSNLKDTKNENAHLKELLAVALEALTKCSSLGSLVAKNAAIKITDELKKHEFLRTLK